MKLSAETLTRHLAGLDVDTEALVSITQAVMSSGGQPEQDEAATVYGWLSHRLSPAVGLVRLAKDRDDPTMMARASRWLNNSYFLVSAEIVNILTEPNLPWPTLQGEVRVESPTSHPLAGYAVMYSDVLAGLPQSAVESVLDAIWDTLVVTTLEDDLALGAVYEWITFHVEPSVAGWMGSDRKGANPSDSGRDGFEQALRVLSSELVDLVRRSPPCQDRSMAGTRSVRTP